MSVAETIQSPALRASAWRNFLLIVGFVASVVVQPELSNGSHAAQDVVRLGDSVWEISSRQLPQCPPAAFNTPLGVGRFVNCVWHPSAEEALLSQTATEPMRTIIYVHGNWMPVADARTRALKVYSLIAARSPEPIRFICFSWPSEQRERAARDIITKKPLLTVSSFYLSSFIRRLPPDQPLSLMGYSFGGAVVGGSLHLLAGGALDGYCLGPPAGPRLPIRVGLVAPAFDQYDLAPNGRFHAALLSVDHLVNLYNSRDPILRRFRFFDPGSGRVAAGFAGLSPAMAVLPLQANDKIEQYDCSGVGRSHDELAYFSCYGFRHEIDNLLGRQRPPAGR